MVRIRTLIDLLRNQAERHGSDRAFTFLENGQTESRSLTYAELDRRAQALAARLLHSGAAGERALLLFPAGLEFIEAFFGCLYAGIIGIPAPPPEASRAKRTWPRLRAIAEDAQASWVLTTAAVKATIETAVGAAFDHRPVRWATSELDEPVPASKWREPALDPAQPAYLQYTSGSTSSPRGVVISHRNLIHHLDVIRSACEYGHDSVTVTWIPNFHDYGLVQGLLVPLADASPCYIMSPFAFVKRPASWLGALSRYRGTHSQAPNFAYDHCVRRTTPEERAKLDLSTWRAAGVAAEPINPNVLRAFSRIFSSCGFRSDSIRPAYGLAEATLLVSSAPAGEDPIVSRFGARDLGSDRIDGPADPDGAAREVVSCGTLLGPTRVSIVDPETLRPCPSDVVGEIWVAGPAVAEGYWRREEETARTFRAYTADGDDGPYLRTGDLGFLKDGQLYVTGRLKEVIIIRGTKHYPQDIEWTTQQAHPALRPENGAAFSVMVEGEEKLVLALEVDREHVAGLDAAGVFDAIRTAVAEVHELDARAIVLLRRGSLPKTASGKIQRAATREAFLRGALDALARWPEDANAGARGAVVAGTPDRIAASGDCPHPAGGTGPLAAEASRRRADDLIAWLRSYAAERINSRLIDERRCIPPYIVLDLGNRGLLGMQVAESHGGLALRYRDTLRVLEQLAAIDLTLGTVVSLNNTNGIRPIENFARPDVRDELLPRLARGRELASFALSEPGAGSNVGGIRSEARRDAAGGWRLRGLKRWNSSSWAGVVSVFVRIVDPDGRLGGLTGFVVRQGTEGLRVGPEAMTMGLRGSVQNTLYLRDVPVGPDDMLGVAGRGMEVADDALLVGRIGLSAVSLGATKRCAQLMHRYVSRRWVATGRLIDNPVTLVKLGELTTMIGAVGALIHRVADALDAGSDVPMEVAVATKVAATDSLNWAAGELVQILGGRGYMENNVAPQILRDARALSIGEGPNEALTAYLGRSVCQTDAVAGFLADRCHAADLATQLSNAALATVDRCRGEASPFHDRSAALTWAHALVGRSAIAALLLASVRTAARTHGDLALTWARLRFDAAIESALRGGADEATALTGPSAADLIAGYTETIGDVEQELPGEELEMDAALQRFARTSESSEASLPGEFPHDAHDHGPGADTTPAALSALSPEEKRAVLARLLRGEGAPELNLHG
jgi:acyl-CoA synthetase (AMP-forming)/AMP-acid ligase II/alkylation response protein AidB-like acyl-CoA dehydrogenase